MHTYLNHAGTSWPKPPSVVQAATRAMEALPSASADAIEGQRAQLATELGGQSHQLVLTPGCTSSLAVAVSDLDWGAGEVALLDPFAHIALERPLRLLQTRGVQVQVIPPSQDTDIIDLNWLEATLKQGATRLVAISAANNITGGIYPLNRIYLLCRLYGALLLVDAAQVAGWWTTLAPLGDMVAFGGHKGLLGPWGVGGLFVCDGLSFKTPRADGTLDLPNGCDVGSVDRAALAGLVAGIEYLASLDRDTVPGESRLQRAQAQADELSEALGHIPHLSLVEHGRSEGRMPMVTFTSQRHTPMDIGRYLAVADTVVSYGLQCAPMAHKHLGTSDGVIRVSLGPNTAEDEIKRLLNLLYHLR